MVVMRMPLHLKNDSDDDDDDDDDDDEEEEEDLKAVAASCRPFFSELSCQEMNSQPSGKPISMNEKHGKSSTTTLRG